MAPVETKSFVVSRGFKYTYLWAKPDPGKPTLVFFHGFPESKFMWRHQVPFFAKQGYGLIVPDLLGYDETDKPTDVKQYVHLYIAKDVVDIVDHEGIDKFVVIGHDWGVLPTTRTVNAYQERILAFITLSVGYFPPKGHWDTPAFCELAQKGLGYETMGYFAYYGGVNEDGLATTPTEATKDIQKNIDSFLSLMFSDYETWRNHFVLHGKAREWIQSNRQGPLNKSFTAEEIAHYKKIIQRDIHTNLMWYRAVQLDLQYEPEQALPDESLYITVPHLFMASVKDAACQPDLYRGLHKQYIKDSTEVIFETTHWLVDEEPDRANKTIQDFVDSRVKV